MFIDLQKPDSASSPESPVPLASATLPWRAICPMAAWTPPRRRGQSDHRPGNRFDAASAVVLQPDGKLVAAGESGAGVTIDFALARYLPDGRLDPTFGIGFEIIVNDLVTFVVQNTSLNPTPVPGGPAGVFTITARLTNKSTENILEPINAVVKTLTNGNKLLSATEGDGGAGSKQAIDAGSDDILIPKESATVQFRIGLANRNRFSFFVDVSGIVGGDD